MKIEVNFQEGQKLEAKFGQFTVVSDQSKTVGGNESMPEPFDYFLASLPLCAGFYVRTFCNKRGIPTDGIKIKQTNTKDTDLPYKQSIHIIIELPKSFPEKYRNAVIKSAEGCTVKKVIQAVPEFSVEINEVSDV